ncbi:MAG: biotin--[acetyl-CoA-carboxylase] ligase [Chitinivibrionales bacterium]|nr:biotin--[acetyl-CoA-carboxylase] ligase [Chitinivibrionales bacterium]
MAGEYVQEDWQQIENLSFVKKITCYDSIDSTNTRAKNQNKFPDNGFHILQADIQTSGRGQRSNTFLSDMPGGLWVSILCRIEDISFHFKYNRAISLAICDTLGSYVSPADCAIKWPNDILCRHRKICGVLLETSPHIGDGLIIGFGLNINNLASQFPPELSEEVTSLGDECGENVSRAVVLRKILENFNTNISCGNAVMHRKYTGLLSGPGKTVEICGQRGVFDSVLEDGRLCLKSGACSVYFSSGPMRIIKNQAGP